MGGNNVVNRDESQSKFQCIDVVLVVLLLCWNKTQRLKTRRGFGP